MSDQLEQKSEYHRRDRADGVSPPDLAKTCSFAEHIVRARGKRTQYTSVSLEPDRIRDFGPELYRLVRGNLARDCHVLVEHGPLIEELRASIRDGQKEVRLRAIQALRYARARAEGLVDWRFDTTGVERKNLITWAAQRMPEYFKKV